MTNDPADPEVWYHGIGSGAGGRAITVETADGTPTGLVAHVPRHSPTGMTWGYEGSGPAAAARSLLIAALGDDAKCRSCVGTSRVVYDLRHDEEPAPAAYDPRRSPADYDAEGLHVSRCWDCDDGYRLLPYQDFKREHVATWGREWRISRTEILTWLRDHQDKQASHDPGHDEPPPAGPQLEAGQ
jgi:hypothetical protein